MRARNATLHFLFAALAVGLLWWTYALGEGEGAGGGLFVGLILVGPAVAGFLGYYAGIRHLGLTRRWHLLAAAITLILAIPLWTQPWHPRNIFIGKTDSIRPGMTSTEVRHVLDGYIGGDKRVAEPRSVPDEPWAPRVTHYLHYRWTDTDGRFDADMFDVYLDGDKVVGVRFAGD